MKYTFFTREGVTFTQEVSDSQILYTSDHTPYVELLKSNVQQTDILARVLFDMKFRAEAEHVAEGRKDVDQVLQIMWDKTKRDAAIDCLAEAAKQWPDEFTRYIKHTDKGHSVFIEHGTVFCDPNQIPKPTERQMACPCECGSRRCIYCGAGKTEQKISIERRHGLVAKDLDQRKAERLERLGELGIGCITEYDGNNGTPASSNFLAVKMDARDRIQRSF